MKEKINVIVIEDNEYYNNMLSNAVQQCVNSLLLKGKHQLILRSYTSANEFMRRIRSNELDFTRFSFPRQKGDRHLCLADYFASRESGRVDVVAFHLATMGRVASEHSASLFKANNYKDYLYFHGMSVEAAEALAELWHKRIRRNSVLRAKTLRRYGGFFPRGIKVRGTVSAIPPVRISRTRRPCWNFWEGTASASASGEFFSRSRAENERHRCAPPGGEVLQCEMTRRAQLLHGLFPRIWNDLACFSLQFRRLFITLILVMCLKHDFLRNTNITKFLNGGRFAWQQ